MCLFHICYHLLAFCVHYGYWVLDVRDDYIKGITNWFIQISLEFTNWLVCKEYILNDNKWIVKLPWPSRKQSTIFMSFNSNLVVLTGSILSAKTDPQSCVDLVSWKALNKCSLYFFVKSFFSAMLGILSTPVFWWLNWTALCTLSKICPLLTTILPLNR